MVPSPMDLAFATIDQHMGSLTKEFLAMAKLLPTLSLPRPPDQESVGSFAFSPVMLAVILHVLVNKITWEGGDDVRSSYKWFLDSSSYVVAPLLVRYFFHEKLIGRDLIFGLKFWIANLERMMEAPASLRIAMASLSDGIFGVDDINPFDQGSDSQETLNKWVKLRTQNLIESLIPIEPFDGRLTFLITDLLDFRGVWCETFSAGDTAENDFYVSRGTTVKVPYMTSSKPQLVEAFDGFKVLGIEYYKGESAHQLYMYILLPDDRNGLPGLVERVSSSPGFVLADHLPRHSRMLNKLMIPQFSVSFGFQAPNTALKVSSLRDLFVSVAQGSSGTLTAQRPPSVDPGSPSTSTAQRPTSVAQGKAKELVKDTEGPSMIASASTWNAQNPPSLAQWLPMGTVYPSSPPDSTAVLPSLSTGSASTRNDMSPPSIPGIFKRASLKVSRERTKAACAWSFSSKPLTDKPLPLPPPPSDKVIDFVANHPFLFLVREEKGLILFMGQVVDPSTH